MLQRLLSLLLVFLSLGSQALDGYVAEMNLGGELFLVNRTYTVPRSYVPDDLVMPNVARAGENVLLRQAAATALEQMCAAALSEAGLTLVALSGYRSYGTQDAIFSRKASEMGAKKAMRTSAPPGASEHQLGLAMDLCTTYDYSLTGRFADTPEGAWVGENAHRFGFIIRYKGPWEDVTGYADEPWHVRYVGAEHAARIYEADIPFEYYIAQLQAAQLALLQNNF